MNDKFRFEIDRSRGLVRIWMSGFYTLEDIAAFAEARAEAHRELAWPANRHVTLNDLREMKVQPQDTVAAFQAMLSDPAYRSRRLAFVVSRSLARAQLSRALLGRSAQLFETVGEAEDYLFGEADQPLRAFG